VPGEAAQSVECLSSKHEALNSNATTAKKGKERQVENLQNEIKYLKVIFDKETDLQNM
jgi:hypothetical protein